MPLSDDEDTYTIPLKDCKVYGAGLKRKRVQFVAASTPDSSAPMKSSDGASASSSYLSIVFGPQAPEEASDSSSKTDGALSGASSQAPPSRPLCEICKDPIDISESRPHEASIAHQVCLEHSHPPSSIDRTRRGLSILQSHGWDPDSREGLGATGGGRLYPVKAKAKWDTVGLGVKNKLKPKDGKIVQKIEKKMNVKEMREWTKKDRQKTKKLQEVFYGSEDLQKYLGNQA